MKGYKIKRWFKWALLSFAALFLVGAGLVWAMLQSSLFNDMRVRFLERLLTEQIGYQVQVDGEVRVAPGLTSGFLVTNASIPINSIDGTDFVRLDFMSLQSEVLELLRGRAHFEALKISGLEVNFLRTEDDRVSWMSENAASTPKPEADKAEGEGNSATTVDRFFQVKRLLNALTERSDYYESVKIKIDDRVSGFEFSFDLSEITFERSEDEETLELRSFGSVNGEGFEFVSDQTKDGPFSTHVVFSDLSLDFEGVNHPRVGTGYDGEIKLHIDKIGEMLDVLKLNRTMEGVGAITAQLENDGVTTRISGLDAFLELSSGRRYAASGTVENVEKIEGVDVVATARFHPEDNPPALASRLSEVKLKDASAKILGDMRDLKVEDARAQFNAFEGSLKDFGPISIGAVRRTPDGKIALLDVKANAGPEAAPMISMSGTVGDALALREFDFKGFIDAPAKLLLADLGEDAAERFGRINGSFDLDDMSGKTKLSSFAINAVDTELWTLDARAESGDSGEVPDVKAAIDFGITDSADFLSALGLKAIDVSPLGMSLAAELNRTSFITDVGFVAGQSRLSTSLRLDGREDIRKVTGAVESDELLLADLKNLIAGLVELRRLNLIVGEPSQESFDDVQPLVLETREPTLEEVLQEVGMQPLVLPASGIKEESMVDPDVILKQTDVDIGIDIKELSGVKGVTSISSRLTALDGKAQLGPVNISYGGGSVTATATMDVIDSPDAVTISGSTGGWDVGELLSSAGVAIDAYGTLEGRFNITGRNDSINDFLNSMQGPVDLSLRDGRVATSLLELAGLGVIPWLFSKERKQKQTEIACLKAPLRLRAGRITFDPIVAETRSVQVVSKGEINWNRRLIDVRVEPRPLNKPLSRTAWPVDITGNLTDPDVKIRKGALRQRRADGADVMPEARQPCVPDILQLE